MLKIDIFEYYHSYLFTFTIPFSFNQSMLKTSPHQKVVLHEITNKENHDKAFITGYLSESRIRNISSKFSIVHNK